MRKPPQAMPPVPTPMPLAKRRNKKRRATGLNAALNQQNRRVLAQHYRAKYGVK